MHVGTLSPIHMRNLRTRTKTHRHTDVQAKGLDLEATQLSRSCLHIINIQEAGAYCIRGGLEDFGYYLWMLYL